MKHFFKCSLPFGCLFFVFSVVAQSPVDTTRVTVLDEIVVTDSLVQTEKSTTSKSGRSLWDVLDDIPGVTRIQENAYPLVYHGQSANNLRIERDGLTLFGINNHGYYGTDVNTDDLESVGVVNGGRRVLSGSGASGGVIKLQSKDPRQAESSSVYSSFGTNGNSFSVGGRYGLRAKKQGFVMRLKDRRRDNISFAGGDTAGNSAMKQSSVSLGVYFDPVSRLSITSGHFLSRGEWERPQGFQNNPNELRTLKNNFAYQSELGLKWGATRQHEGKFWFRTGSYDEFRDSYDINFLMINVAEVRSYKQTSAGHRTKVNFHHGGNLEGQGGVDLVFVKQNDGRVIRDFVRNIEERFTLDVAHKELRTGLFYHLQTKRQNPWNMEVAIRGDMGAIGERLEQIRLMPTGSFTVKWQPRQTILSSWTLGRYFRWPSYQETAGELAGGRGIFLGNSGIKPETSYQLDWLIRGSFGKFDWTASSWAALFTNRITEVPVSDGVFSYENVNSARTVGMDLSSTWRVFRLPRSGTISLIQQINLIKGDELVAASLFDNGTPLFGIPPGKLSSGISLNYLLPPRIKLNGALTYSHNFAFQRLPEATGRQIWAVVPTPAYSLWDFSLDITYFDNFMHVDLGIQVTNLTDRAYVPFGIRIPGMGRNLLFSLAFNF